MGYKLYYSILSFNYKKTFSLFQTPVLSLISILTSPLKIGRFKIREILLSNSDTQTAAFYIDSEVRDEIPVFSYVLKAGWSNLQIGQLLFKKEGLDDLLD